mgnify:CR=1 FL=1
MVLVSLNKMVLTKVGAMLIQHIALSSLDHSSSRSNILASAFSNAASYKPWHLYPEFLLFYKDPRKLFSYLLCQIEDYGFPLFAWLLTG